METQATQRKSAQAWCACAGVAAVLLTVAGCSEPQPRGFADFMEDRMAMEGTLARCNADREGTHNDLECANARRAASAIALIIERDRRETLERESERKLTELRAELEARERAARDALTAAETARQEAYEAQWRSSDAIPTDLLSEPSAGATQGGAEPTADPAAQASTDASTTSAPDATAQIPRPFRAAEANAAGE